MKKQRWRTSKGIKCWVCPNNIIKEKGFQIDEWTRSGKRFVRCHECMKVSS